MKKGDLELQTIGTIILAIAILIVIIIIIMGGKDKLLLVFDKMKEIFKFR